jgi:hypothetical protein
MARYDSGQMTDEGQEGQDSSRKQRTFPAITDWACCSLASLGAMVALTVVIVLVMWHAGPTDATALAITNRRGVA